MTTEPSVPEEVLSALRHHQRVLIAAHTNPDPDAMGSCLALAWALRSIGVDALVFNEDGLPERLRFLTLPGPVLSSLESLPCEPDLVACLDCGDRARLGDALQPLLDRVPSVNIDHHLANPLFGTEANWVDPAMAATGEMIAMVPRPCAPPCTAPWPKPCMWPFPPTRATSATATPPQAPCALWRKWRKKA